MRHSYEKSGDWVHAVIETFFPATRELPEESAADAEGRNGQNDPRHATHGA